MGFLSFVKQFLGFNSGDFAARYGVAEGEQLQALWQIYDYTEYDSIPVSVVGSIARPNGAIVITDSGRLVLTVETIGNEHRLAFSRDAPPAVFEPSTMDETVRIVGQTSTEKAASVAIGAEGSQPRRFLVCESALANLQQWHVDCASPAA